MAKLGKDNFEGHSHDSLYNEFTNLETNAEYLMSNVAGIQSHTHSINLGSSNPHTNGDALLDQHLNLYIASTSGNVPASQIEMPRIQPQNPRFATENLAKEISSEPGMFEDMNSTQIPEDVGGFNFLDYTRSKHGLQSLKTVQDVVSTPSNAPSSSCFDSISAYSGSKASVASGPLRRSRGPLSKLGKLGMNAVRKVGACWRCRFLRKPMSEAPYSSFLTLIAYILAHL
jgi:hypothetical protein